MVKQNLTASPWEIYAMHLKRGELAYQFSPAAGRAVFYPRLVCPFTGSEHLEWRISAGLGTVYATTVLHPRAGLPYNIVLIDCDEGFRLMSRVTQCEPEMVRIGMRVRLLPRAIDDASLYPIFVPASSDE